MQEYGSGLSVATGYLQGSTGVIKSWSASGTIYYYQDKLGSTTHAANASGQLVESYKYDLYGTPSYFNSAFQPINSSNVGVADLYAGERYIPELSLYDLRNRMMSPELGRFLQADPIGFKGDASNLYRYCGNDPIDKTDPMGLVVLADIAKRQAVFDTGSSSQAGLEELNKFQQIQNIIAHLIAEIADAKKVEERSGSKVSWEFKGNWAEPYGNHVTGEKFLANKKPAAGRTDPSLDVHDKPGGVAVVLVIDWKVRRSVASDPQVGLWEVRDHVAGMVRWGIAMQKHTNSGEAGQTAAQVRNFLNNPKTIGGIPQSRFQNEITTQKIKFDMTKGHGHDYHFDPNAD